jgi:hypothetical protein
MKLHNRVHVLDRLHNFCHRQQYYQEHLPHSDDEEGSDSNDYVFPVDPQKFEEFAHVEYPDEVLISECNSHVVHAQAQHALAKDRIEAAK